MDFGTSNTPPCFAPSEIRRGGVFRYIQPICDFASQGPAFWNSNKKIMSYFLQEIWREKKIYPWSYRGFKNREIWQDLELFLLPILTATYTTREFGIKTPLRIPNFPIHLGGFQKFSPAAQFSLGWFQIFSPAAQFDLGGVSKFRRQTCLNLTKNDVLAKGFDASHRIPRYSE